MNRYITMGRREKTSVWVLIRRYDQLDAGANNVQENLYEVAVPTNLTFDELKSLVYSWAEIEESSTRVLKIRQYNNSLVPLSTLLQGSSKEKPFLIDIVGVHQFCPVEKRTLPPGYIDTLKTKLTYLEKRIKIAETEVPEMASVHMKAIEEAATQLSNCVRFLDRRLDELTPLQWKQEIESIAM